MLDTLNSASMDDLPVLVGFLLQSVNPGDAQEVPFYHYNKQLMPNSCLLITGG